LDITTVPDRPRLARDVELLGPYRDSGLENPPYLIRRGAAVLQVSRLLHLVAEGVDDRRDYDEIADAVGAQLGRQLSDDDVRYLVEEKLVQAGIVATPGTVDRGPPPPAAEDRLLGLRFRQTVLPPEAVNDVARHLGWLFRPVVVAAILAVVVGFDAWLFGVHGVKGALEQVIRQPGMLTFLFVLGWLSTFFHELGHAAGCRYSGARPGAVGAGIYLIWPVMCTNVTDAYRLGRSGRLRTDLGGVHFNAVFIALLAGAYAVTGYEPLVAAVLVQHFLILDQLMPWVRLDGHYVLSDLTGVPDILDRVRPAIRSLVPGRPPAPEIAALRPAARRLLFAYLGSLVVFVAAASVMTLVQGPTLLASSWDSLPSHIAALKHAVGMWDLPVGVLVIMQIVLMAAPAIGFALTLGFVASLLLRRRASAPA
jgi:putative peptide zinc metalloprotease protein